MSEGEIVLDQVNNNNIQNEQQQQQQQAAGDGLVSNFESIKDAAAPEYWIANAADLFNENRLNEALLVSLEIYHQYPKDLSNLLLLSSIHFKLGQFDQCIDICDQILFLEPICTEALYNYAWARYHLSNSDEAKNIFELIIGLDDTNLDAFMSLVSIHCEMGSFDQAIEILSNALELSIANPTTLLPTIAALKTISSKFDDATDVLMRLINTHESCFAYLTLGFIEATRQNFHKALFYLEQSYKLMDATSTQDLCKCIILNLSNCLIELGQNNQAMNLLINGLPQNSDCYITLAKIAYLKYLDRDYQSALNFSKSALISNPRNSDLLSNTAVILRMTKKYTTAMKFVDQVISLSGYSHRHNLVNMAHLKLSQGMIYEAISDIELSIHNFPFRAENIIDLATLSFLTHDHKKLIECFNSLSDFLPNYQLALVNINNQLNKGSPNNFEYNLQSLLFFLDSNQCKSLPLILASLRSGHNSHSILPHLKLSQSLSIMCSPVDLFNCEMVRKFFCDFDDSSANKSKISTKKLFKMVKAYFAENSNHTFSLPIIQIYDHIGWPSCSNRSFESKTMQMLNLVSIPYVINDQHQKTDSKCLLKVIFDSPKSPVQKAVFEMLALLNRSCENIEIWPIYVQNSLEIVGMEYSENSCLMKLLSKFDNYEIFDFEEIHERILPSDSHIDRLMIVEEQDKFFFDTIRKFLYDSIPFNFWLPFLNKPTPVKHRYQTYSFTENQQQQKCSDIYDVLVKNLDKCLPEIPFKVIDNSAYNNFAITTNFDEFWQKEICKNEISSQKQLRTAMNLSSAGYFKYSKHVQFWQRSQFKIPDNIIIFCSLSAHYEYSASVFAQWAQLIKSRAQNLYQPGIILLEPNCSIVKGNILKSFASLEIPVQSIYFIDDPPKILALADIYLFNPYARSELTHFYHIYFSGIVLLRISNSSTLIDQKLNNLIDFVGVQRHSDVEKASKYLLLLNFQESKLKFCQDERNNAVDEAGREFRRKLYEMCLF